MASTATSTTGRLDVGTHVTGKHFAVGAGIVLAVVVVAIGVTAAVRSTDGQAAWETGLNARSDALNRQYGLGTYSAGAAGAPASDAHQALRLRSEALNRKYGLGAYAVGTASAQAANWHRGLSARNALNSKYGVGTSSAASSDRQQAIELRNLALNRAKHLGT
jgi:hypothetical protein